MLLRKLKRFAHIEPKFTGDFCVFLNYSDGHFEKFPQREYLQIACFDPGIINTGCRIERRYFDKELIGFSRVETVYQNRIQTATKAKPKLKTKSTVALAGGDVDMKPKVKAKGKRSRHRTGASKKREPLTMTNEPHYYIKMSRIIRSLQKDLSGCDYILIESQLTKNPEAGRMAQHIVSTILSIVNDCGNCDSFGIATTRPLIVEVAPYFKSRYFGVRKHKGLDLKDWATIKAFELLEKNKDIVGKEILKKDRKKDDQSDAILYCEAWGNTILGHIRREDCTELKRVYQPGSESELNSDSDDSSSESDLDSD